VKRGESCPPLVTLGGIFDALLSRAKQESIPAEDLLSRLGEAFSLPFPAHADGETEQIQLHSALCHFLLTSILIHRAARRHDIPVGAFRVGRCQIIFRAWSKDRRGRADDPTTANWIELESAFALYGSGDVE